ncbi:MAG: tetratricopeptide repeat protein, partial [Akkermansiaceae bacterium]
MIIAHLRTFLISAFFVSSITSLAAQDAPSQAEKSASLIRAKQYPAAIQSLSGNLTKMAADDPAFTEDQLMLLKARALHLHKQHADSAKVCKELLQKFPASKWQHKTRFLMAHTHAARGDYQTALSIYEKESTRLFSAKRKDEVARSLIEFADLFAKVPSPEDLDAPKPDFKKAYNLYKEVLDLNCSPALKEQAHFLMVRMSGLLGDWATASKDATTYLSQYDPSWRGVLLSKQRLTFQKNTTAKLTGKHRSEVRYRMAEALHRSNSRPQAVRYLDELMAMLADGSHKAPDGLAADAAWLKLMAMRQQGGRSQDVNHWVTAAKAYLKTYPTHIHASRTALLIPEMLASHNEPQKAIAAYQEYLKTPIKPQEKPLTLETETRSQFLTRQERAARQMEEASYQIGTLYLRLKQFANARTAWNQTAKDHPNGARWADSQKGIIDVDFEEAMEAIRSIHAGPENNKSQAAKRASELLKKFNQAHPLSDQAPNILFLLGRIPHQLALDMDASEKLTEAQSAEQKTLFKQAITVWDDLLSKYPKSTHSTLAKEHIGIIYEQRLGDLEKALSVYKQTKSATASARYSVLTAKRLIASSPKVFRTDEKPVISLSLRNIEKVTVRQYWLDLESYFRKARKLGNISELDVDLVEPDKQWDVTIDGYKKYLPLEKEIPAPFDGNKPGVCVVKVEGGGFVSTTVLVRSDIDIAVRSSKDELLALATNWRDGSKPSAGTKLLIADGGKVIASGKTGNDGVLHIKTDQLKNIEDLRVLALSDAGAATCDLNLSSLVAPPMLIEQAWFNTPQAWYRPGETVQLSGIIRIPNNGIYQLPTKDYKQWKLRCLDMNGGKLIHEADITLNDHGSFSIQFAVPQGMSSGKINATLISTNKDKPIEFDTSIAVKNQQRNRVILTMDFPKTWTSPGEKINGKVTAKYHWGA